MRRNQDHLMPRGAVSGTIGAAGYSFAQWLDLRGPNGLETQGDLEQKTQSGHYEQIVRILPPEEQQPEFH